VTSSQITKRILVVDNESGVRKTTREILESKNYDVYAAEGVGEILIKDAYRLLTEYRCHLVILDLRLHYDNDPNDWSGLEFASNVAKKYPWVACVFLTGYGSFELARRALGPTGLALDVVKDIALKAEGPASLLEMADRAFNEQIKCRWDQILEWAGGEIPDQVLKPLIRLGGGQRLDQATALSEFVEILGRLFPQADTLSLSPLSDYEKSTSLTQDNSILLRVESHQNGRWLEDVVVKIGCREAVLNEVRNYGRYVSGQIGDHRHTFQQMHAVTWLLGGIVYTLIGAELDRSQTLKEFYHGELRDARDSLDSVLNHLFGRVFRRWYEESKTQPLNLWAEYRDTLGLDKERLNRLDWGHKDHIEFNGLSRPLPGPIKWIERHAPNSLVQTRLHTVHGDLHSRNIFTGPNHDVWLIDFERTGPGHCLRDFIELETDIKFSLLALEDLTLFYHFEVELLGQNLKKLRASNMAIPSAVRQHAEAKRAFRTIIKLRRLAIERIRYEDLRDYFWGLLCQTLFVATLSHLPEEAQHRAKLSAALICERLGDGRRLQKPWPPKNLI
jgi:CheY-like chemotaxis protein